MANQQDPSFLDYADKSRRVASPLPAWLSRLLFRWFVVLVALVIAATCVTEYFNYHFDSFFPRKTGGPGLFYPLAFRRDLVDDEGSWRDWRVMETRDITYYWRPLSSQDQTEMAARLAEGSKWNFFVVFVRYGIFSQLAAIIAIWIVAVLLRPNVSPSLEGWRWRIVKLCVIASALIAFLQLCRGYIPAIIE